MKGKKIELTEEQARWFRWAYPRKKNAEIAKRLGVAAGSVKRLHDRLCPALRKSKRFKEKCIEERVQIVKDVLTGKPVHPNSLRALEEHRWRGGGPGQQSAEHIARRVETCNKLRKRDKARLAFGFDQRTHYHFRTNTRQAYAYRYKLRQRGYITERFNNHDVWYDENTRRSARCELFGAARHNLRFHHINEKR